MPLATFAATTQPSGAEPAPRSAKAPTFPDGVRAAQVRAALLLGAGGVVAGLVAIGIADRQLPTPPVLALLLASALPGALAAAPSVAARLDARVHARLMRAGIPVQLALLLAAVAIDGNGAASPLVLLLVLPLLPAAWSLSPLGVCVLGALGVAGVAVLAHAGNALTATAFATAAVMGLVTTASGITARAEQRLREAQTAMNAELTALAHRDGLTGCLNHRAFQERLNEEANRAQRHHRDLALVLIDLDGFKTLNDTYGHPAGDRILRAVGSLLAEIGRSGDVAGRLGGDEFALLLPETSETDAVNVTERLRQRIRQLHDPQPVTASIGIAGMPSTAAGPRQLVDQADEALYAAKNTGSGLIRVYGSHLHPPAQAGRAGSPMSQGGPVGADHALARRLAEVVDRGQLTVQFQPVVRLVDEALVAYHAVVSVGGSELPLSRWLAVAEHSENLRVSLEEASWTAVGRCGRPPDGIRVFVEVSEHASPTALRRVIASSLSHAGERVTVGADTGHRAMATDLAAWGQALTSLSVEEARDSSPAAIDRVAGLQPRWLKVPASWIAGCDQQPGRLGMIGALRAFADRAGGELLPEGVARTAEAQALRTVGLRYAAGPLWGEPGPPWPAYAPTMQDDVSR